MSARHGDTTGSHSDQGIDSQEAGDAHRHQVLQRDNNHQQDQHDHQQFATLLDDFQVALKSDAGKEGQHEDGLQCAIERHLYIETTIQHQGHQRKDDTTAYGRRHTEFLQEINLSR